MRTQFIFLLIYFNEQCPNKDDSRVLTDDLSLNFIDSPLTLQRKPYDSFIVTDKPIILTTQCIYVLLLNPTINSNISLPRHNKGHAVAHLVQALRYKPEGRGFDFRWCHWNFSLT